jgi:hypothetical protein
LRKVYAWSFILLLAIYISLTFILPVDPHILEKYGLTQNKIRLLNFTIVIPVAAIYLVALYGFIRFYDYTTKIQGTKEGRHFDKISKGLLVLAFSLPITSIVGAIASYIKFKYPDALPITASIQSYITLILSGIAILLIAQGAQGLFNALKKNKRLLHPAIALAGPIILASVYTWLITTHGPGVAPDRSFYLPDWIIVFTLAVPYTFIWCVGFNAIFYLREYKNGVRGIIYKRAFEDLSKGFGVIILMSITIQFITTLSAQLSRLNLTPLLALVYLLVLFYAVGYGFVARGANKLRGIEEA